MNIVRRKIGLTFLAFAALVLAASPALAETFNVFGVKQYIKPKGAPVSFTDTFAVPAYWNNFTLVVTNGSGAKDDAKNFSIILNGKEVLSAGEMKGISSITKPISVGSENTLQVSMKGPANQVLFVEVRGTPLGR